ncbi:MAG TPA: prepilin-type N-terminal cleavage/methylation domain-containing protein [Pseudomonas xinjiangensis]|uniref:Prepilin-type N-terminal cleavage/methylation domain-containing protein n=2 Tax=root TaxID=1 RepID=A0A7V1FR13_9GAMM|nr:prepilin-type N-terminal cleavage/methylation domain-containing protein [Halopseudomonas xinjiangensis]HEC49228.1 prepilin-type N-terminal cleavage/methylation domain-containing protein [Halopseudomonas xinjiangensis]
MSRRIRGFSLVELLIALALGLILVLGVVQVFLATKQSFVIQRSAASLQENARFILSRIAQELRMVNMYGCLDLGRLPQNIRNEIPVVFATPISFASGTLTIIVADPNAERFSSTVTRSASDYGAKWLIATDCRDTSDLRITEADLQVRPGDLVIPIRQVEYRLQGNAIQARSNGAGNFETLVDGVQTMNLAFGLADSAGAPVVVGNYAANVAAAHSDRIRSIRLALSFSDVGSGSQGAMRVQQYTLVAALRNRMN